MSCLNPSDAGIDSLILSDAKKAFRAGKLGLNPSDAGIDSLISRSSVVRPISNRS